MDVKEIRELEERLGDMHNDLLDVVEQHGENGISIQEMIFLGVRLFSNLAFDFAKKEEAAEAVIEAAISCAMSIHNGDYDPYAPEDDDDDKPHLTIVH
mgnify:CR=1 FL=1